MSDDIGMSPTGHGEGPPSDAAQWEESHGHNLGMRRARLCIHSVNRASQQRGHRLDAGPRSTRQPHCDARTAGESGDPVGEARKILTRGTHPFLVRSHG